MVWIIDVTSTISVVEVMISLQRSYEEWNKRSVKHHDGLTINSSSTSHTSHTEKNKKNKDKLKTVFRAGLYYNYILKWIHRLFCYSCNKQKRKGWLLCCFIFIQNTSQCFTYNFVWTTVPHTTTSINAHKLNLFYSEERNWECCWRESKTKNSTSKSFWHKVPSNSKKKKSNDWQATQQYCSVSINRFLYIITYSVITQLRT